MKTLVVLALGIALVSHTCVAGDQSEKRIHAIEERFTLKFVEEIQGKDGVIWMFVEPTSIRIHVLAIAAPRNATDKEVKAAKTAAEFACGWFEGCLRVEERSPAPALPTPPPSI